MIITKCVDGVAVSLREAQLCAKYLFKVRKSIKDKAELESRFDDFIRQLRSNNKGGDINA